MKINKKNIIKNIGSITLAVAITTGAGIVMTDSLTNHQNLICQITTIENAIGLNGNKHQIERIEEDYKDILGYKKAETTYLDTYYPQYLCFEEFTNGLCNLYNIDTKSFEEVNVHIEDYDISYIGVKEVIQKQYFDLIYDRFGEIIIPDNYYLEKTADGNKLYKINKIIVTTPVIKNIDNQTKEVKYALPEGYTLKKLYTLKYPLLAFKTIGIDNNNEEKINYLILKRK